MEYVILDLEWNSTYSTKRKKNINEIIEFGAVKFDENLQKISTFSRFVKPQISKFLSIRVKRLTNITSDDLSAGIPFMTAFREFREWVGSSVLMSWGTTDITVLMSNFEYYAGSSKLKFIKTYLDAQLYCQHMINYPKGMQIGLSACAQLLGIDFEENELHRALGDSELTLDIIRKVYDKNLFKSFFHDATNSEFYRWITFKTTVISDMRNPIVRKYDLSFECGECNHKAKQSSKWDFKNKWHRAEFICPNCGHKFIGRIQFKVKYEGIVVSKKIFPFVAEETSQEDSARNKEYDGIR